MDWMKFGKYINVLDSRKLLVQIRIEINVCIALHAATALPGPSILPSKICAAERDDVGTTLTA